MGKKKLTYTFLPSKNSGKSSGEVIDNLVQQTIHKAMGDYHREMRNQQLKRKTS
ncbi:hypothetical protein [Niallia sp.]|uniref:hypothetical protein n=1 Tax=Niallia sp. TaxID=2837523 RepID=UPI002899E905|nr:hypothetical protein [Niallia sp.]